MMPAPSLTPFPTNTPVFKRRGLMFVLASPPGGGKTTITRELMKADPDTMISISATTRDIRPGEVEGQHYYFVSDEKFKEMIKAGEMLEHQLVYNNYYYGTPKAPVEKALSAGRDILFDIDWQGTRDLTAQAPDDVVSIFLLPPSWQVLSDRLHHRARESEEEIARRLSKAAGEISHYNEFQYVVINDDLQDTISAVKGILKAERQKRQRLLDVQSFVDTLIPPVA